MNLLELFAGTKSIGNVASEMGMNVFSTDIKPEFNTDYTADILAFDCSKVPFIPDIIWASPPCTWFTVMQIGRNWNRDHTPKTDGARLGMEIVKKTVEIINYFSPNFWFIENPVGKLRKLDLIPGVRFTVTYCQYGDTRMKPTDIWTNAMTWNPRPMCRQGSPCHISAPRGSRTKGTTQGYDSVNSARIPRDLCVEILKHCIESKKSEV